MGTSAIVVGSLVSGYMASQGAQGAASTQAEAGLAGIQTQQQMLAQQQALGEPFRAAGLTALERLLTGTQPGGEFATPFRMEESQAQQFATKSALDAMRNQMAMGGQNLSTNAIVGAGKLASDIGSQFEAQAYNQWLTNRQQEMAPLQNLATLGQAAATGQAANIGQAGANITGLQTGIGNALAAGQVGQSQAASGAVNNISQYLMMQSLLNQNQ